MTMLWLVRVHHKAANLRRPHVFWAAKYLICCTALLIGFTGCITLSFTYNHAERLLLWRIDRYFQLSQDQDAYLKAKLSELYVWHRQTELPRYSEFLRQVNERWQDGLTLEEIDWSFDTFAKLRGSLADRIAGPGSAFLVTVDAKQLKHLERVVQREHRQWQARAGATPEERSAKRAKNVISSLRDWLGPLTVEQERLTERLVKDMTATTDDWFTYRMKRKEEFVQLLQSRPKSAVIEHKLEEWFEPSEKPSAGQNDSIQRLRQDVKRTILTIDRTITSRQRAHASEKLQKLIGEIQSLAAS